jgi:hypothetical protein
MLHPHLFRTATALAVAGLLAPSAAAQFNDQWTSFTPAPTLINAPAVSSSTLETDLAWGDLDQNGLVDLVVARVQPIMQGGTRTNMLLMSEAGVLVDRTGTLASASDVPGDQGFSTPTSDRDVVVVDVDGDGWLDVVTAVGFGLVAQPKHISHPRVYINLGTDVSGNWLGLRHEDARIPTLINFVSGLPVAARFNAVAAGDVDGDGDVDLYFGDHDGSPSNPFGGEPANLDTNDRLFINDGNGFFTDATMMAMTPAGVVSNFCNSAAIADFDGDGFADIAKQTNGVPGGAAATVAYGNGGPTASFGNPQTAYAGSAYAISTGDLNNDGRLDLVVSENGKDGVVYNTGTTGGQVNWSPLVQFNFLSGGDDSFAANSLVADLDGDGLQDVLVADVDPQISGFNRRLHIYHNRGVQGTGAALLREERRRRRLDRRTRPHRSRPQGHPRHRVVRRERRWHGRPDHQPLGWHASLAARSVVPDRPGPRHARDRPLDLRGQVRDGQRSAAQVGDHDAQHAWLPAAGPGREPDVHPRDPEHGGRVAADVLPVDGDGWEWRDQHHASRRRQCQLDHRSVLDVERLAEPALAEQRG